MTPCNSPKSLVVVWRKISGAENLCILLILVFALAACIPQNGGNIVKSDPHIKVEFLSDDGERMSAIFTQGGDAVNVTLPNGKSVTLARGLSGSGARYVTGNQVFWEHQGVGKYTIGERLIFTGKREQHYR